MIRSRPTVCTISYKKGKIKNAYMAACANYNAFTGGRYYGCTNTYRT